jgi:hypothetical protein
MLKNKTQLGVFWTVVLMSPLQSWASPTPTIRCLSDDGELSLANESRPEEWVYRRVKQNVVQEFLLSPGKDLTIKRWDISKVETPLGRFSNKDSTVEMWLERIEISRPSEKAVVILEVTPEGNASHTVEKIEKIITCRKTTSQKNPEAKLQILPTKSQKKK